MSASRQSHGLLESLAARCGLILAAAGALATVAQAGPLGAPGDLYVISFNTHSVIQFDAATGALVGTFAQGGGGMHSPFDLRFGPNGNLFITNQAGWGVSEYDGQTGEFLRTFTDGHTCDSTGLAFKPDGNLLVANLDSLCVSGPPFDCPFDPLSHLGCVGSSIAEFDGTGEGFIATFAQSVTPEGLRFGPDGALYVSVLSAPQGINRAIIRYTDQGALLGQFNHETVGPPGDLLQPEGLDFGPDGNLYVADGLRNNVKVYDGVTGERIRQIANDGSLYRPIGLEFGPDGNLFVSSTMPGRVVEYDITGQFIREITGIPGARGLTFKPGASPPPCLADIDGDGDADVADFFAFVVAFASGDPAADVNGDGSIDVGDFFAFVAAFAVGCA